MRHGRRDAAGRDAHLPDLGLREQRHVEADLGSNAGRNVERAAELRDPPAARVPRDDGLGQVELLREQAQHLEPAVAERRQRPGRSAQLGREPRLADLHQAAAGLDERDEPGSGLCSERRRHRLLQQRAAGHDSGAMRAGELRARRRSAVQLAADEQERAPGDEHRGRVHRVLACRAPVDVAGRLAAD